MTVQQVSIRHGDDLAVVIHHVVLRDLAEWCEVGVDLHHGVDLADAQVLFVGQ